MDSQPGQTTTLGPDSEPPASAEPSSAIALTIVYHPDTSRIGQRALLRSLRAARSARLSRLVPKFGAPGESPSQPLEDGRISRQPVFLEASPSGDIVINADEERTRVVVDGQLVVTALTLPREALARGVFIELAERVALLLHYAADSADAADNLELIGEARSMQQLRARIRRVAPHPMPVLIRGESGVGKELVAAAIHRLSQRSERALVSINMAAVPPAMAVSAMFGHAKGAFTGAVSATRGYFGRADGGTLFLDEVGDTPANVQAQLLRVLESGEVQAVGEEQPARVDVRLIAATDVDLEQAVGKGSFRQALLQRLGGYVLLVPALRDRREDIGRLFIAFLHEELSRFGRSDKLALAAPGVRAWLPCWFMAGAVRYDWPGNVRELRNAARQVAIDWVDAPEILRDRSVQQLFPLDDHARQRATKARASLEHITDALLLTTLKKHRWRPAPAAADLGISRTSLYALMRKSPSVQTAGELTAAAIADALKSCGGDIARAASQLSVSEPGLKRRMHKLGLQARGG